MQNITVITVGKQSDENYKAAAAEYVKRLGAFCKINTVEIAQTNLNEKNISQASVQKALEKEAAAIVAAVPKGSALVAMCIEGKHLTSEQLASYVSDCGKNGTSHICFVIGSSFGLCENLKQKASLKLSLSKMTFAHKLANVMLLEQIYRAFSINAGTKYHK